MYPFFVAVDIALAILSLRCIVVLGTRAPWTSAAWAATLAYCISAGIEFSVAGLHAPAEFIARAFLLLLTCGFVIAGIRDERQAEPWWWPTGPGSTRAEKREAAG